MNLRNEEFEAKKKKKKRNKGELNAIRLSWRRKWQPTPVLLSIIPWTEEPGRLHTVHGAARVRLD